MFKVCLNLGGVQLGCKLSGWSISRGGVRSELSSKTGAMTFHWVVFIGIPIVDDANPLKIPM